MDEEVKAAAEIYGKWKDMDRVPMDGTAANVLSAVFTLADAMLPLLDPTPATIDDAEVLCSYEDGEVLVTRLNQTVYVDLPAKIPLAARGDLRLLCRALGITI